MRLVGVGVGPGDPDLVTSDDAGDYFAESITAAVGAPVSIGNSLLQRGNHKVVIRSIELAGVHGLRLVGVLVTLPIIMILAEFYPPPDDKPKT